ncbi:hypothetical protein Ancab_004382 [Ancistrocladus abbreviatus]
MGKEFPLCEIRPLGGRLVLLFACGESSIESIVANNHDTLFVWFDGVCPWRKEDIEGSRIASLRCLGDPLHVWTVGFLEQLAQKWGSIISVVEETKLQKRFDVAQFTILTSKLDTINAKIRVKIDEDVFPIKGVVLWCSSVSGPFFTVRLCWSWILFKPDDVLLLLGILCVVFGAEVFPKL